MAGDDFKELKINHMEELAEVVVWVKSNKR